jgi:hypothetical protein
MKEYGEGTIPLSVVGMLMNYAGNHMLHYIWTVLKRKIFFPMHKVVSVQLLSNGEIITTTKRIDCIIKKSATNGHTIFTEQESTVTFRSKGIVISNGGVQGLHPQFYKWFPALESQRDKVILGDAFLRKDLFKSIMSRIKE